MQIQALDVICLFFPLARYILKLVVSIMGKNSCSFLIYVLLLFVILIKEIKIVQQYHLQMTDGLGLKNCY